MKKEIKELERLLEEFRSLLLSIDRSYLPTSIYFRYGRILGQFDVIKEKLLETKTPS